MTPRPAGGTLAGGLLGRTTEDGQTRLDPLRSQDPPLIKGGRGRLGRTGVSFDRPAPSRLRPAYFEYSGPLTEVCLLGNVAKRLDARLYWDAANMRVTNNPAAEPLITRPYREGWRL